MNSRRSFLMGLVTSTAAMGLAKRADSIAMVLHFDVVVVGGTTAGVAAAIAAGRHGMRVAVIEETPTLGGLIANGLCNTDASPAACTGIFNEFRRRCLTYYLERCPDDPVVSDHPMGKLGLRYEPSVAERLFREMVADVPSIEVFYERHVTSVQKLGNRVTGVVTRSRDGHNAITFRSPVTIDATHEGDLLPMAGAAFRLGREPRSSDEPHAGAIYMTADGEVFGSGKGDERLQAYALLATVKDYRPGLARPVPRPRNYDPRNYVPEPIADTFWHRGAALPNRKFELNENLDGTDVPEINATYITGDRSERRRVWEFYRDYTLGYVHFRQTVMGERHIGLADDEFVNNDNLPYILYVREGRRLEGVQMVTERDCLRVPGFPRPPLRRDSIAVSDWKIDSHAVARDTEGYLFLGMADRYKVTAPAQAPYGIMVPTRVDGLLVPMAVSATHVGFQVLRLEPVRVAMGQAAGNAAAICVKRQIQPRDVPVTELQQLLLSQEQALYFFSDVMPDSPHFKAIQRVALENIDIGYDDFTYREGERASYGDMARYLFYGMKLSVKLDYTDLWKIVPWRNPHFTSGRRTQHCTPGHWSTYYVMTLYNLGAFSDGFLETLDPNAPAQRRDLVSWSKCAVQGRPANLAAITEQEGMPSSEFVRGELADFIVRLTSQP